MTLYLKCLRGVSMCHVRKHEPTEEDPAVFKREGAVMLAVGRAYPLIEVPNPFDPEGGSPWLAVVDPSKNLDPALLQAGDMVGLNKFSLALGPKTICQLVEQVVVPQNRKEFPSLLR